MKNYDPRIIEPKWQKYWEANKSFTAVDFDEKPKKYVLDMFPYPSGAGLHVGHPVGYTATDIYCRYLRMNGYNVLHPMGWDAFGLPAENYAIKTGTHPKATTDNNIVNFRRQIRSFGFSYDWSREIDTTDPKYYKWTQWIFIQLFKHGLAYESVAPINFCPSCKTGLANEEVNGEICDRCGSKVERRRIRQWILKITEYADRLLKDLEKLDWPEPIKQMQKNWIGRSEGTEIVFKVKDNDSKIKVFTTRADTLYGCTYIVLAPESDIIENLKNDIFNYEEILQYVESSKHKSDLERADLQKEKSGIEIKGVKAINPINDRELSIWVADYVLSEYGTGAVMAVPAHDQRDFEFAIKYKIDIVTVIDSEKASKTKGVADEEFGKLVNSGDFSGLKSGEAIKKITEKLKSIDAGDFAVNYKLRDWIFSRQRYWGEPIPIIHCQKCGPVAVPDEDLPIVLPEVENYEPSGDGDSPLANIDDWVNTTCPKCHAPGKRETNTMPQWAGSCWYHLAYATLGSQKSKVKSQNYGNIFSENKAELDYWLPVDLYVGGAEHAVLHLLYARFWHKFMFDLKIISDNEPFIKLRNQGMILAEDGRKMSKSLGNVINPDDVISRYGADTLRLYEMFMGPFEQTKKWDTKSISGVNKFLKKVWRLCNSDNDETIPDDQASLMLNSSIEKVTNDIEEFRFNTAISQLMILTNHLTKAGAYEKSIKMLLILLSPFAPHICEELWEDVGGDNSILSEKWPKYDNGKMSHESVRIVVQVNGKKRMVLEAPSGSSQKNLLEIISKNDKITGEIKGSQIGRVIFVPDRLINLTTKD